VNPFNTFRSLEAGPPPGVRGGCDISECAAGFPPVRELADDGIPVAVACRVLDKSRSGFYDWLGRPDPPRELRGKEVTKLIREIHAESRGSYGSPRVHAGLRLGKSIQVNRKRVERP
jgi:putative transposase